ncbi:MAG: hypothetical protein HY812_17670 [Planctomycetes bacterium]|nr:hypothetical protein [Planctomycetota bacterium]
MSDSETHPKGRLTRRLWHGGFGAFTGAVIGMVLAGWLHSDLVHGALYGTLAGLLIGFFLGLGAIQAVSDWLSP